MDTVTGVYQNKDLLDAAIKAMVAVLTFVGGLWALYNYIVRRDYAPLIEFDVDVNFVGRHNGRWVVEVVANIYNKGHARLVIRKFDFDIRTLDAGDEVKCGGADINSQTVIPNKVKEGSWLPSTWKTTFVDPQVKNRYSYVADIPESAKFVLIHGRFSLNPFRLFPVSMFYTSDKLIVVPSEGREGMSGVGSGVGTKEHEVV